MTFASAIALHILIFFDILSGWIGAEGFYAHYSIIALLFLLYPLTIVAASLVVAFWAKKNRAGHFFVALFMALFINSVLLKMVSMHGAREYKRTMEQMYIDDPQTRPLWDSQRPLSIITVAFVDEGQSSALDVIVHALPGVLESGESTVEVKGAVYPPNSKPWGEGVLYSAGELTQGGRAIYSAKVSFNPEEDWYPFLVLVRGLNGEFTSSSIQKR